VLEKKLGQLNQIYDTLRKLCVQFIEDERSQTICHFQREYKSSKEKYLKLTNCFENIYKMTKGEKAPLLKCNWQD